MISTHSRHPTTPPARTLINQRLRAHALMHHGVGSFDELELLGVPRRTIERRVKAGDHHLVHRGVVALGHGALSERGRCAAAIRASSGPSAITGHAAAWLYGALDTFPVCIDVSAQRHFGQLQDVRHHRARHFDVSQATSIDRIPVVDVPELILSLGAVMQFPELAHVLYRLAYHDELDLPALLRRIETHRNRRGIRTVRAAVVLHEAGSSGTRSKSEVRMHSILVEMGAPKAIIGTPIITPSRTVEPDFAWPRLRLALEVDGPQHDTPEGRREDALRDAALRGLGWTVVRVRAREVWSRPHHVTRIVRNAISNSGGRIKHSPHRTHSTNASGARNPSRPT